MSEPTPPSTRLVVLPHTGLQAPHHRFTVTDLRHHLSRAEIAFEATLCLDGEPVGRISNPRGRAVYRALPGTHTCTPADIAAYATACRHPVPLSELGAAARMVCDACSTPSPSYVYIFGEQTTSHDPIVARVVSHGDYLTRHSAARTRRVTTTPGITQNWGQRWALCTPCADLVDHGDVYGLVGRVCDAMPAKYTRGQRLVRVRGELHATYTHLIATRQPGRGLITAEHPLGLWPTNPEEKP
jgi:hypothetical protein